MPHDGSVAFVLSKRAVSSVTGWPIGFRLSELTRPYREFVAAGYDIALFSPDGGPLYIDDFSDPCADHGHATDDEISRAFLDDRTTRALLDTTSPLSDLSADDVDAVLLVGNQGPMETFHRNAGNLITGQQPHSGAETARLAFAVLS